MCAIAGMIALPNSVDLRLEMLSTMKKRGPDGTGWFSEGQCTLLHSRLAVVDVAEGKQPMQLFHNGQWYTITYNGEIYNAKELRQELSILGHRFETESDTEVVLHGYAQWGESCLKRFNGIFAFGIWENRTQRLFLARDPMGVKPLFYMCLRDGFLFASEIKTILSYPGAKAELDETGVGELLLLGPGRTPGSGVFRNVQEVEPGYCGYFQGGKWRKHCYFKLRSEPFTDSFPETVEKVRYLVKDAISRQMVCDVPFGTFLSGGLDSSMITAYCASQVGQKLPTFSLDYANNDKFFVPEKFQPSTDNAYIELMHSRLNTEQHWTVLTPEDLENALEDATCARDLPGMADVDSSLLCFCKDIARSVKVAISGECADELFGGYPWYRDPQVRALQGFPWAQNTAARAELIGAYYRHKLDPEAFVMDRYNETLADCDILPETKPEEKRMKEMMNLNYRWFMQTLIDRNDRMSMWAGMEVRTPFCDKRIAQYLYNVPWEFKDYEGREKGLLRKAAEGLLPEEVLYRKKCPFPKTYDSAYAQRMEKRLQELFSVKDAPIWDVVDKANLQKYLLDEISWPWYGQLMRKPQTMAYMLQLDFWLRHYNVCLV